MPRRTIRFRHELLGGSSTLYANAVEFAQKIIEATEGDQDATIMIDSERGWDYGSEITILSVEVSGTRAMTAKDRQRLRAEERERQERLAAQVAAREASERETLRQLREKYPDA